MDRVTAACDYLLDLRQTRRRVAALPPDVVPRSLAEGYEVQDRLSADFGPLGRASLDFE